MNLSEPRRRCIVNRRRTIPTPTVANMMDSPIVKVDDKHVPLYRIVWVSDVPHFCGEDDCLQEGDYEIRLDVDDSLWTNSQRARHGS